MEWPLSWEPVIPEAKRALAAELKREAAHGHPLHSVAVEAIARRHDSDDVLFAVEGAFPATVVHLSYSMEKDPLWPETQFFGSLEDWAKQDVGAKHL